MPVVVLIAIAAVLFLKPWKHLSVGGPALPTLTPAVTPAQPAPSDHSGTTKLTRGRLEVLLSTENQSSTPLFTPVLMHWSCTSDPSGQWDYNCLWRQNDSVWGFDVDNSRITSRSELSWEGHTLIP
jgi:hypothetical protein